MTNEKKAQMLVDGLGIIYTDCNRVTIKKLLMKMAEWKEQEMMEMFRGFLNSIGRGQQFGRFERLMKGK